MTDPAAHTPSDSAGAPDVDTLAAGVGDAMANAVTLTSMGDLERAASMIDLHAERLSDLAATARSDNALLLGTLVYAFRYALRRSSYAPSDVMHVLRAHAGELDEQSRVLIVREITAALVGEALPYADEWRRTRDMLAGRMVSP